MSDEVYLLAMNFSKASCPKWDVLCFCCRPSQHDIKINPVYSIKYVVLMSNYITYIIYNKRKVTI